MIDPILILQQTVNFFILLFILHKVLYKPVRKFLDERTASIEEQIRSARQQNEEAEQLKQKLDNELANARLQAKEYMDQAVRRSEQIHEDLLEKAKKESAEMHKRTQAELAREKNQAWNEIREDVVNLSISIASKVVKESLDEKKHEQLISDVLQDLEHQELGEQ